MNAVTPTPPAAPKRWKVGTHLGTSRHDVSSQWVSRPKDQRYVSLGALESAVLARKERSRTIDADTKKIEFLAPPATSIEATHELWIGMPDGTELAPNHWSFGQLAALAAAPAGYLRTLPSQIVGDALTYGMRYNREGQTIKLYGQDDNLAAATGPDYGRIYDAEVVAAVRQIAGDGTGDTRWKMPGRLDWQTHMYNPDAPITLDTATAFASDRDCFIFLVDDKHPIEIGKLPDGSPDYVFRGFYVKNSEVGAGSFTIATFYLRAICDNRILWGVEGFEEISMRHSKYAPARFIEQARPALESFAKGDSTKLIGAVAKAKDAKLADNDDEALAFLQARDFSRKLAIEVIDAVKNEEGHPARTAWDFAQGITAAARKIGNNDARVDLETKATRILEKVTA